MAANSIPKPAKVIMLSCLVVIVGMILWVRHESKKGDASRHKAALTVNVQENHDGEKPVTPGAAITIGNHSYVKIGLEGTSYHHVSEILQALTHFESQHPDLQVVTWQPDVIQPGLGGYQGYIAGIWIDHVPKADRESLGSFNPRW